MAEDEIAKHSRAVYKAWKNPHTSWQHKLREIITEVLIITFAISLSVWLHNWSDELHEHREEKEFLTGLRKDLQGDLENVRDSRDLYLKASRGFRYFTTVSNGTPLSPDSADHYNGVFFNTTDLDPHTSRYEGLKGSGKFGVIENKQLLNDIIDFHESTIHRVDELDHYYVQFLQRPANFFETHAQLNTNRQFIGEENLIRAFQMRLLLEFGREFTEGELIPVHDTCIARCQRLMTEIDGVMGKE